MKNGGAHKRISIQRHMIKGIQKNVLFLEHTVPESSPTESTDINQKIVILTPYTGQLKIKNQIRNRRNDLLSKVQVRGGAMQVAKCIECKGSVGGNNHDQLLPNNRHSDIDGSNNPLYKPFEQPPDLIVI
ncbi:hypothetical protein ACTA71_005058 [Dictyostelium dimigraforme]